MRLTVLSQVLCLSLIRLSATQGQTTSATVAVTAALQASASAPHTTSSRMPPAVLWLVPLSDPHLPIFANRPEYVLSQKNKMFSPHLLIVPVGASVAFPNRDPFFHNVFSLFEGKRFDLGLYESGKTKYVTFPREGVSYIFCNIHPEMSAVIVSLTTPLFSVADANGRFTVEQVTEGDYAFHLWVEGQSQTTIDRWTKKIHVSASHASLGTFFLSPVSSPTPHANKFGQPYVPESNKPY